MALNLPLGANDCVNFVCVCLVPWTGLASKVYFHIVSSVPRIGFRSTTPQTRVEHLLVNIQSGP